MKIITRNVLITVEKEVGGEKCSFLEKFGVLFSCYFEMHPFALLPTNGQWWSFLVSTVNFEQIYFVKVIQTLESNYKKLETINERSQQHNSLNFAEVELNFTITHLVPLVYFHTPWKYQKTKGLLVFSGGIERDHWHEMSFRILYNNGDINNNFVAEDI